MKMGAVVANMSMSLDGFIADPSDQVGPLFDWYGAGEVEVPFPGSQHVARLTPASARYLRQAMGSIGALIAGRRLFDLTQGWGGSHPAGVPVFVVTHRAPEDWPHRDAPFTFVTDGVESAVAQARKVAGEKVVSVASPTITQQCLNLGLLDAIAVDLVPVLLGKGIRFFDNLAQAPVLLEDPTVIEGRRVTHLYYQVRPIEERAG
jgi:dihydrofolate reductase